MMEFCGMRGEHPADFCDIYNHALFNPILYLHGILGLVILLDIAFIWLSREKRLLSGKINGRIIVGMLLMGFLILTLLLTV